MRRERASFFLLLFTAILGCGALASAQAEGGIVTISVTAGTTPTFSWSPDSTIGRLIVEHGAEEVWGSETEGTNIYRSPIRYGVHPAGASEDQPADPLVPGETYKVSLYRWISVNPEKFLLMGELEFKASAEPEADQQTPAVGLKPTLRVGALLPNSHFDGRMNGPEWHATHDSIADLITMEPVAGGKPAGRTIVKVIADAHDIVVGVQCFDNDPQGIVSYSKARDSELEEEDHIILVFDTFRDGRSGYVFAVNPSGARYDGLIVARGEEVNSNWDAIWEAKTTRDDKGWQAEFRIPAKSLSFKKGLDTWGFNVQRRVQRLQETSRWSGANIDHELYQTSRSGLLTGIPAFDYGVGLSVRPAVVGRLIQPGDPNLATDYDGDISLDATQKLGPNFLSALTLNTDFAETEVDVRQTNLTRFPVFFPEKRTFFLEGADIFDFGLGLDEETVLPFNSRRIGLLGPDEDDQVEVPINVGGKIQGRAGNTNVGGLVVNTRDVDQLALTDLIKLDVPNTTMGAFRLKQNVFEESSVGVIGTFGDQQGRDNSWMGGLDFTYQTSNFMNEKNLLIGTWGMLNDRVDLNGDKSAFGVRIDYPNDLLDANLTTMHIGDGFDPSLGFVPRNNVHIWDFAVEFNPRPSWSLVHQMFHELSGTVYNKRDNSKWESYSFTIKPLDWLLRSGEQIDAGITPEGDRPSRPFEIASDVDVAAGSYEWTRYFMGLRFAEKRRISGHVRWETGRYYDGDLNTLEGRVAFKPSALTTLEFTGELNDGKVIALIDDYEERGMFTTEKTYKENLFGVRFLLNFSADLQFSSFTQYDSQSKELGSNNRLRWTFDRLGDIFIVYNHNLQRVLDNPSDAHYWRFVSNEMPVKIQYAFRF